MSALETFIRQARKKGLNDDQIRQALIHEGWEPARVDVGLKDLAVPAPEPPSYPTGHHPHAPSLSPLMAALHHILLWFFTASSTVTIVAVIASLFGTAVSSGALASMVAVTLVTLTPYAVLFSMYLRRLHTTPNFIPGRIWSIITICLHSIGAMVAAIVLVTALINSSDASIMTGAALVLLLDGIVITTYVFAAFAPKSHKTIKLIVTRAHLPLLVILFGVLVTLSVTQLGPARYDERLRKDLTLTVKNIRTYAANHQALPANNDSSIKVSTAITYQKKDSRTYEVCATFKTNNTMYNDSAIYRASSDSYVSDATFLTKRGYRCFEFTSDAFPGVETKIPSTPLAP